MHYLLYWDFFPVRDTQLKGQGSIRGHLLDEQMARWIEKQNNQILFSAPIFIFRTRIKCSLLLSLVPSIMLGVK